jgi:hypothetical protein
MLSTSVKGAPRPDDDQLNRADYKIGVSRFPNVLLATRIFTTLENGRIDYRLRRAYRGIRRDLDFVQQRLIEHRPPLGSLPVDQLLYELLFQIRSAAESTMIWRGAPTDR